MHVLFVSACEKKALKRSRALLDSYALRVGERTWASPMTQEGLENVRSALAKTATRQTAVACYSNDGRSRMKLMWIVGSRQKFGPEGQYPVGKQRAVSKNAPLPWLKLACMVAALAGLEHDFGKYSRKFQAKLRSNNREDWVDAVRHEWISLKIVQALRSGLSWHEAWESLARNGHLPGMATMKLGDRCLNNSSVYATSSPLECVDALIATHHKLFAADHVGALPSAQGSLINTATYVADDSPLLQAFATAPGKDILELVQILERRLGKLENGQWSGESFSQTWRAICLLSRAALVFADHTVSAREYPQPTGVAVEEMAFANTNRKRKNGSLLNQPLDEHLRQVSRVAADAVWRMANLADAPDANLCGLAPCAVQAIVAPADENSRFAWQNRAANALATARENHPGCGVLLFNMAGTGCGKTRMNVRAACVLSASAAPRISIALNLRTLTLQTGHALQADLGIGPNDCATVIGDAVATKLFQAASKESFGDPWQESEILAAGGTWPMPSWLEAFFVKPRERKILGAPLLVSTVDFLAAAGDPFRQGHHVKAMLRIMTSDLILDEVDAYEPEPLAAVLRLVQLAGLFRRNVVCSSATLSLPVQQAVEAAYASGLDMSRQLRQMGKAQIDDEGVLYLRAYIDNGLEPEIVPVATADMACKDMEGRIERQMEIVRTQAVHRRAKLLPIDSPSVRAWQEAVASGVEDLHVHNHIRDCKTGVDLSFGLVRVANIGTAITTARFLASRFPHAKVACYHSGDWRISRFYKEQRLDFLLARSHGDAHILNDAEIRKHLDGASKRGAGEVLFIVVATPVEEIGRDHDFDWAVVDVSSAQSLVQTAGRVNRHRLRIAEKPNIAVPRFNWRHCRNADKGKTQAPAFCWPGYEGQGAARYALHDLGQILPWQEDGFLTVNADLRFGECRLAKRDDKAIQARVFQFFAPLYSNETQQMKCTQASRFFCTAPVPATLMADRIYLETQLRASSGIEETWRIKRDGDTGQYAYEQYILERHQWQWTERGSNYFIEKQAMDNAWLWLDFEAMHAQCEQAGILPSEGMVAELTRYGDVSSPSTWEYDMGFGLSRA